MKSLHRQAGSLLEGWTVRPGMEWLAYPRPSLRELNWVSQPRSLLEPDAPLARCKVIIGAPSGVILILSRAKTRRLSGKSALVTIC